MSKATQLKARLGESRIIVMPGAYNALVAKQIEQAGFEGVYVSGAGLSNSWGVPDIGKLTLDDFVRAAQWVTRAVDVPVISDADTGFSNIGYTVERYIKAGLAGMHIEDQVSPKRCGHLCGKEVIPYGEMVEKIKAAVRARDRYDSDFLIIARTDARGATNVNEEQQFEETIQRGKIYLEAGSDMTFPESLRDEGEFRRYKEKVGGWLFANMTEFGETPYITWEKFEELGYHIVIFPVTLLRCHAGQTNVALQVIKDEGNQQNLVPQMITRDAINELLGYNPRSEG